VNAKERSPFFKSEKHKIKRKTSEQFFDRPTEFLKKILTGHKPALHNDPGLSRPGNRGRFEALLAARNTKRKHSKLEYICYKIN
jgi:hypothetical protein